MAMPLLRGGVPASGWPRDGSPLDRWDKKISGYIMRLQLGVLEWPLSVPGFIFGNPLILLVGPPTLAWLAPPASPSTALARTALASAWGISLGLWFAACYGRKYLFAKFYRAPNYILAPWIGLALAGLVGPWRVGAWYSAVFFLVSVPVRVLKRLLRRRRPVVCGHDVIPQTPRAIDVLVDIHRGDGSASFPSGDVAGAAPFGMALAAGCGMPMAGCACVALSAFGRMYWRAHHALDVLVGGAIGAAGGVLVRSLVADVAQTRWWHLPAAQLGCVAFELWLARIGRGR